MSRAQQGRHLPAFILLFLAKEQSHGLGLVGRMNAQMPSLKADGPAIYRALADLEKQGAVEACWATDQPGAAKKCYSITAFGKELLLAYAQEIEERQRNLAFFLDEVSKMSI